MRNDQTGFTIIELLIAVAILSIVTASVCGFILVGSKSYASANSDINVQQEAQLSLNQMSDVMIDTTRSVSYAGYDADGAALAALKDAEFAASGFAVEDKSLTLLNGVVETMPPADPASAPTQALTAGNGNENYRFYWDKDEETLYYAAKPVVAGEDPAAEVSFPDADRVVLAERVKDFSVDLSQVKEKRVVRLSLTFRDGNKEYATSNNITLRNQVGVNDVEIPPLDKEKTIRVEPRDTDVVLEPSEVFHFSVPKVWGKNVADKSVTWSLPAGHDPATGTMFTDAGNGILKVGENEPGGTLTLTITTNAVGSDGKHASCTLDILIKRVTDITFEKIYDSKDPLLLEQHVVSPGSIVTIKATVHGENLGKVCSKCGEDTSIDDQVYTKDNHPTGNQGDITWRVWQPEFENIPVDQWPAKWHDWDPEKQVSLTSWDGYSATFYVEPDTSAAGDHIYYIQTTALLSYYRTYKEGSRFYPWVWKQYGFTVKQIGGDGDIQVNGGFLWGAKTQITCTYPSDFNTGGQGYYIICARVREWGASKADNDKIVLFRTTGNNTEITPDLFGVEDISKPWYISLQILDPKGHIQSGVRPSESLYQDLQSQINDQGVKDLIVDYLANCDASGTYVGAKYPHTGKYAGKLNPPEILYAYQGTTQKEAAPLHLGVVSLMNPKETKFEVLRVRNTRDDRDGSGFANQHIKFSVYKEKADGGLEDIHVYQQADGTRYSDSTKDGSWRGTVSPFGGVLRLDEVKNTPKNPIIKVDANQINNQPQEAQKAVGRYRIVPTIQYHNNPDADTSYQVYYANYQPWYGRMRVYQAPQSAVFYELTGSNLKNLWGYCDNRFTKGDIYFPLPSVADFADYFNREDISWQEAKRLNDFKKIVAGTNGITTYRPARMRCRYVADQKAYELELFYYYWSHVWNRNVPVSAGVYRCGVSESEWERQKPGTYDSALEKDPNFKPQVDGSTVDVSYRDITENNRTYRGKMYIPLPWEEAFTKNEGLGFQRKQTGEQTVQRKNLRFQQTGQTNTQDIQYQRITCTYDQATDVYTIRLYRTWWTQTVSFEAKSGADCWTQVP